MAWLQTANAAEFSSSGPGLCRCTEPLRGTHNLYSRNSYLESFSHILRKAQQNAVPVRGNGDMFSPSHLFHSSVCQHCKNQIENKWRNLEVNWTAELEKIDLVWALSANEAGTFQLTCNNLYSSDSRAFCPVGYRNALSVEFLSSDHKL